MRHQHDELLAAGAGDHVGVADDAHQQAGDAHEHLVAGVVAVLVVDALEVVEVEDGEAEGGLGAVELAREEAAVVQAGQPVAVGLLAELLLEAFELRVRGRR